MRAALLLIGAVASILLAVAAGGYLLYSMRRPGMPDSPLISTVIGLLAGVALIALLGYAVSFLP